LDDQIGCAVNAPVANHRHSAAMNDDEIRLSHFCIGQNDVHRGGDQDELVSAAAFDEGVHRKADHLMEHGRGGTHQFQHTVRKLVTIAVIGHCGILLVRNGCFMYVTVS